MIIFFVPGEPIPKQSFRFGSGRGRNRISVRVADWQETISGYALNARQQAGGMTIFRELMRCRVSLTLHFYRSVAARSDIDNLTKAVLDGLKLVMFEDDRQVRCLHAYLHDLKDTQEDPHADKDIKKPGVEVSISYWPQAKSADPAAADAANPGG